MTDTAAPFLRRLPGLLALCLPGMLAAAQPEWCERLTPRLPGISNPECRAGTLSATGAQSPRGFPILARESAPSGRKEAGAPLRILLLGGIHGDEPTASSIVFKWMRWLERPEAAAYHWKVAPILNPDGLLAARPQRVNAHGVDLNRNFPTPGWQREARRYWEKVTGKDPRRFPGNTPLSEPESRWVSEEIERFRPQLIVSVHAPFGVLDFDGPARPPSRFGRLILKPVGIYPGSLGNYGGVHKNIPVVTIELPNARDLPPDAEVERIWRDMLAWIRRNMAQQVAMPEQPPRDS